MSDPIAEGLAAAKGGDSFERARVHDELQHRLFDLPRSPQTFGRFTIIRRLGQGAMGLVYLAYDPVLDRNVALKLLHATADAAPSTGAAQPLRDEARATAKLNHPNVVTVYEVGEADGRAFLSMEYVDGENLEEWLAAGTRDRTEIFAAFEAAGRGLAAAHEASIVHRDFKPRNVLVARDGRVCVVDFGLARAHSPDGDSVSASSNDSARATSVAGTPAYMAPEVRDGFAATEKSDQYSFCVALYEALHGRLPDAQMRPNPRLQASVGGGRVGARVAAALAQGLRPAASRRHPSMTDLVGVLHRAQQRKGRRIAAVLALPLIAGAGWWVGASRPDVDCRSGAQGWGTVWGISQQATVEARLSQRLGSAAVVDRLLRRIDGTGSSWRRAQDAACMLLRDDPTNVIAQLKLRCLDARLGEVRAAVATFSTASTAVANRADVVLDDLDEIESCNHVDELLGRPGPPTEPGLARDYVYARDEIGAASVEYSAGMPAEARARLETVRGIVDRLGHPSIDASFSLTLGNIEADEGAYAAARAAFVRAHQRSIDSGERYLRARVDTAMATLLGNRLARHEEGLDWVRMASDELAQLPGAERERASLLRVEAGIHVAQSDYETALEKLNEGLRILESAPAPHNASLLRANLLLTRAAAYVEQGKIAEALADGEDALDQFRLSHGDRHPAVGIAYNNLAKTYMQRGSYAQAETFAADALAIFEETREPSHPDIALAHNNLGTAFANQGRFIECLTHFERALQIWSAALGDQHPHVASASGNLALALMYLDREGEALVHARRALTANIAIFGEAHDDVALQRSNVARIYIATQRSEEAVPEAEQVVAYWRGRADPPADQLAGALLLLGTAERILGRWPEAVAHLREAIHLFEGAKSEGVAVNDARLELAKCLWLGGIDRKQARIEIQRARAWLHGDGQSWAPSRLLELESFARTTKPTGTPVDASVQ